MKAEVITAYTDRLTGEVHLPGETVDLSDGRLAELAEGGFVRAKATRRRKTKE